MYLSQHADTTCCDGGRWKALDLESKDLIGVVNFQGASRGPIS